jgi:hypothetical protein
MSSSSTVVMSSIVKSSRRTGPGACVVTFDPAGEPHATAMVEAVIAFYPDATARPAPGPQDLAAYFGTKVTLLRHGKSLFGAQSLTIEEGTLIPATSNASPDPVRVGLRPKGGHGRAFVLACADILDVQPGYGHAGLMRERIAHVRDRLPRLKPLTGKHLAHLPSPEVSEELAEAGKPVPIGLALMGTWRMGDITSPAAVWLIHSYDPGHDIAEGYLLISEAHGYSEHGSVYGRDLLRFGGRIIDPPQLVFDDAFTLGRLPQQDWLVRFTSTTEPATATAN